MTIFHRAPASLLASGAFILALFSGAVSHAGAVNEPVMLINLKTGKCLTISGGESDANNLETVQFDCDSHPSRSWMLRETSNGVYQIRNVRTGKCLTISGGISDANNLPALQFDCDNHPSRTWRINDVTGSGINQISNVQTGKCVTIAGGESPLNNVPGVQFTCDGDLSRRWTIRLKL